MDTFGPKVRNRARSQDVVAPAGFEMTIAPTNRFGHSSANSKYKLSQAEFG